MGRELGGRLMLGGIVRDVVWRRLLGVVHADFYGAEAFQNALTY